MRFDIDEASCERQASALIAPVTRTVPRHASTLHPARKPFDSNDKTESVGMSTMTRPRLHLGKEAQDMTGTKLSDNFVIDEAVSGYSASQTASKIRQFGRAAEH
ncbi:uncharacterized protein TrAtP1_010124 [Trichoderma atroviride]|uniref:uncharacterized protein n=1 Tax=Hypocrea atroviridis TaxID=63577 RepID=UPI00332CFC03|nr:hypothetical protein TrAtP1_010124 [Trichoderma atroviride]